MVKVVSLNGVPYGDLPDDCHGDWPPEEELTETEFEIRANYLRARQKEKCRKKLKKGKELI